LFADDQLSFIWIPDTTTGTTATEQPNRNSDRPSTIAAGSGYFIRADLEGVQRGSSLHYITLHSNYLEWPKQQ